MYPLVRWVVGGGALLVGSALIFAACSSSDDTTPTDAAGAGGTAAGAGGTTGGTGGTAAGAGGTAAGAGGTAAGAGGTAAGAGGTAAGAGGSAGGAGGAKTCGSLNPPSAKAECSTCLASKCCDEQIACTATATCLACNQAANPGTGGGGAGGAAGGPSSSDCNADPELSALTSCLLKSCAADCELKLTVIDVEAPAEAPSKGSCIDEKNPLLVCNPLKHTGCTKDTTPDDVTKMKPPMPDVPSDLASGYACDGNFGQDGKASLGLICFGPPNTQTLNQPCGDDINKYCADGFRCMQTVDGKKCASYCCNDGDCSAKGKCDTSAISDISNGAFGVCVVK
jgi:hypothetical protein